MDHRWFAGSSHVLTMRLCVCWCLLAVAVLIRAMDSGSGSGDHDLYPYISVELAASSTIAPSSTTAGNVIATVSLIPSMVNSVSLSPSTAATSSDDTGPRPTSITPSSASIYRASSAQTVLLSTSTTESILVPQSSQPSSLAVSARSSAAAVNATDADILQPLPSTTASLAVTLFFSSSSSSFSSSISPSVTLSLTHNSSSISPSVTPSPTQNFSTSSYSFSAVANTSSSAPVFTIPSPQPSTDSNASSQTPSPLPSPNPTNTSSQTPSPNPTNTSSQIPSPLPSPNPTKATSQPVSSVSPTSLSVVVMATTPIVSRVQCSGDYRIDLKEEFPSPVRVRNLTEAISELWREVVGWRDIVVTAPSSSDTNIAAGFSEVVFMVCSRGQRLLMRAREEATAIRSNMTNGRLYNLTIGDTPIPITDITVPVAISASTPLSPSSPAPSPSSSSQSPLPSSSSSSSSSSSFSPRSSPSLPSSSPVSSPLARLQYSLTLSDLLEFEQSVDEVSQLVAVAIAELLSGIERTRICCIGLRVSGRVRRADTVRFDTVVFSVEVRSVEEEETAIATVEELQRRIAEGEVVELTIGSTTAEVSTIEGTQEEEDGSSGGGLETGVIAAIVIAGLAVVLFVLVVALSLGYFIKQRRHYRTYEFEADLWGSPTGDIKAEMMPQAKTVKAVSSPFPAELSSPDAENEGVTEYGAGTSTFKRETEGKTDGRLRDTEL